MAVAVVAVGEALDSHNQKRKDLVADCIGLDMVVYRTGELDGTLRLQGALRSLVVL
jgi:hypothetical protein